MKKEKKLIAIIILFLILTPFIFAQLQDDYNDKTFLDLNLKVKGSFKLIEKSQSAVVSELMTNLTFFPKEEINQEIISLQPSSNPQSKITQSKDSLGYIWSKPTANNFEFSLDSNIKVRNALIIIDNKINFPLENVETFYTNPTEYIDFNNEIRNQAQLIANGEDDLYVVAFKVADWVQKNINYNLTTLTAEVVEKSSWVFKNKQGVCDELTNLYISMLRSLGIPARFVSGVAYTNTRNEWGPHAWAEVYFPNKGWVPFDVTYTQFGWIDPSHIKIKSSTDSGEPAVRYVWKANDVDFEPTKLDVTTTLINSGNKIGKQIDFKIKPLINNVGPGSYVPIEVELKNKNPYYFPLTLTILKAPKLTERNYKAILLKPGETKKVTWIAQIPEDLEENFIYRSVIEIEDNFHNKAASEIIYSDSLKTETLEEAQALAKDAVVENIKILSAKLDLECTSRDSVYFYESLDINCSVRNKGNTPIESLNVCIKEDCNSVNDLGISETKQTTFIKRNLKKGQYNFEILASTDGTKASDIIKTIVLESPELEVSSVIYNSKPNYDEKNRMEITLSLKATVKDMEVYIDDSKVISSPLLKTPKKLIIVTSPSDFIHKNKFRIYVRYKDENEKEYQTAKDYPIKVQNIPWYIKILAFLRIV